MAGWNDYGAQSAKSGPWAEAQTGPEADIPASPPAPEVYPVPRKPSPRLKLSTVAHCKREIARIIRMSIRGEMPVEKASKLVNMLQIQSRLIVDAELEKRIEELEQERAE